MPKEEQNLIYDCECCGGTFLKVKEGEYKCDHCGYVKHIETTNSSEIVSLLNNANILRNKFDFDEAAEVFEQVVKKDPNNPEGYWGLFLCEYGIAHQEDPKTHKFLPTCNRASVVSVFEDENYQKAVELATGFQKEDLEQSGKQIEEIIKRVVKLSKSESPYDIFICYKKTQAVINGEEAYTKDSVHAREIYEILTKQGYKVFFAEKTLQNVAGNEYEAIIFNALNTSKVMLVVCSKLEHANAPWVKNEWRRFVKQMEFDESKKLLPIMCGDMSAGKLPDLLKRYQALEINVNFQQNLLASVKNCIGLNRSNVTRVEIGQVKSAKKSNTIKSAVETRKITANKEAVFKTSDQVQLKNAFMNLNAKTLNLKDAWEEFSDLKDNPKLEPIADYVLELIKYKVACLFNADVKKQKLEHIAKLGFNKDVFLEKFNRCVENADKDTTETIFLELTHMFDTVCARDKSIFYTAIMSWNYGDKKEIMKRAINYIKTSLAQPLLDAFIKFYDPNDVDGYIETLEDIASHYTKRLGSSLQRTFKDVIWIYDKILEVDEGNNEIRWKKYLASIGVAAGEEIRFIVPSIEDKQVEEFKEVLSYTPEKERATYIDVMTEACCRANYFVTTEQKLDSKEFLEFTTFQSLATDSEEKKPKGKKEKTVRNWDYKVIAAVFDKFVGLYSEKDTNKLAQKLYEFGGALKSQHHFEDAIKYFNMAIQEGDNNIKHKAYWGIMQCKMKCVDDEDVIYHKTPVKNFAEFQSAINAAGEVGEDAVEKYLIIKNKQAKAGKDPRKKNKKSKNTSYTKNSNARSVINKNKGLKTKLFLRGFLKVLPALLIVAGIALVVCLYIISPTFMATPISTVEDLKQAIEKEGGRLYLAEDLDLKDYPNIHFENFDGRFYGNGKIIKNYTLTVLDNTSNVGFFGYLDGAKISDLTFENASISVVDKIGNVGVVAGDAVNTIFDNITIDCEIIANHSVNVGGVVGRAINSTIKGCKVEGDISASRMVGGIVGANLYETNGIIFSHRNPYLINCETLKGTTIKAYNYYNENEGYSHLGGIVGKAQGTLENLTNNATIINANNESGVCIGGICGSMGTDCDKTDIKNLENNGNIEGKNAKEVGGIFGYIITSQDRVVKNLTNNGEIVAKEYVGGIAGKAEWANFENVESTETSKVTANGTGYVGGIVGLQNYGGIKNATNEGEVTMTLSIGEKIGGIVGRFWWQYEGELTNLKNTGKITSGTYSKHVGGIIGSLEYGDGVSRTIKNARNEVEIHAQNSEEVGGICGRILGESTSKYTYNRYGYITFDNCAQIGDLKADAYLGRFVGYANLQGISTIGEEIEGELVGFTNDYIGKGPNGIYGYNYRT